ncbi:alpha/beta fold hydrolase [Nocardia gipuzkoensis]|uniref:alpha/beta fold hydrolase n=1 Tax=Nocardia gipuzkoensis TaxID=2749991 RepID=UPI0015EF1942|nr:hypothetical protein [Nocardia gipuzkoensis]
MGENTETGVLRTAVQVDGETASYLTAGQVGPTVLLLHGTYWSRVWLPVLGRLAEAGLRPVAVDFPGLGRSGGELTLETATVPALAEWVARFASALASEIPHPTLHRIPEAAHIPTEHAPGRVARALIDFFTA